MRTFAFIPSQVNKTYVGIISKYKRYNSIVELFKVSVALVFLFICGFVYLYFVNISSTRGYFLKQTNQETIAINFQYEIIKTKLLDYKQQNRFAIQSSNFRREVINVSAEIVKIPNDVQLGLLSAEDVVNYNKPL